MVIHLNYWYTHNHHVHVWDILMLTYLEWQQ